MIQAPEVQALTPGMQTLTITYFSDNKGRNELVRLILAAGKIPYKDHLIGFKEYAKLRDSNELPYGQLPVLTITNNGDAPTGGISREQKHVYGQSCAIARFAAKKAGLYPKDDFEMLVTDGVVDSWRDTLDIFYETVFARAVVGGRLMMLPHPQSLKVRKLSLFLSYELEEQFSRYDRMLAKSPGGTFCNDDDTPFPSWADLAVFDLVETIRGALTEFQFDKVMRGKTGLLALVGRVEVFHLKVHPYRDISSFFAPVSFLKRVMEFVLFPVLYCGVGIYTRIQAIFGRGNTHPTLAISVALFFFL